MFILAQIRLFRQILPKKIYSIVKLKLQILKRKKSALTAGMENLPASCRAATGLKIIIRHAGTCLFAGRNYVQSRHAARLHSENFKIWTIFGG